MELGLPMSTLSAHDNAFPLGRVVSIDCEITSIKSLGREVDRVKKAVCSEAAELPKPDSRFD